MVYFDRLLSTLVYIYRIVGLVNICNLKHIVLLIVAGVLGLLRLNAAYPKELPVLSKNSEFQFNSLFFTFDYLSQSNTLGVVNESVKQPSYSSSILFYSKYDFDIGISGIVTENSDTGLTQTSSELDFMAGYSFTINDDLTIYPSYTHLEFSQNSYTLQSVFRDIIQTDVYFDKQYYYGGITASYLFGEKNMFFASVQNAFGFDKEDFLFKDSYLNIHLEVDINFSDKNYYNDFIYFNWNTDEFLSWVSEYYPRSSFILGNQVNENGLESTKSRFYDILIEYDPELFESSYSVTSVDFMLPFYYSIGAFMFNFTSYIIIPTFDSKFYEQSTMFIFNAGIAYSLNF